MIIKTVAFETTAGMPYINIYFLWMLFLLISACLHLSFGFTPWLHHMYMYIYIHMYLCRKQWKPILPLFWVMRTIKTEGRPCNRKSLHWESNRDINNKPRDYHQRWGKGSKDVSSFFLTSTSQHVHLHWPSKHLDLHIHTMWQTQLKKKKRGWE